MDSPEAYQTQLEPTNGETSQAGRQIARAAGIVMIAYVFSTLIGIIRA